MNLLERGGPISWLPSCKQTDSKNILVLKLGLSFRIYHPVQLLMESKALIGVNMLRIADYKPNTLKYCKEKWLKLRKW
ncbi:MAG: hypothetical protein IPP53_15645 [Bacteroidetes bacterium]|nr:hypothetical protein [Bacteroidota bacterium]